jgi:ribosomal protein L40E
MPTTVDCPACERKLRVPDRLRGKQVKCPECGDTFPATPLLETPPPPAQPETLIYPPDANPLLSTPAPSPVQESAAARPAPSEPARLRDDKVGKDLCPQCNAPNSLEARRCGRCGVELETADERWQRRGVRRDSEPHRGQTVITLGVISVVCGGISMMGCPFLSVFGLGLGIPTWVMGQRDLKKMRSGVMDPRGEAQTRNGWVCGIVGTILSILGMLVLAFIITLEVFLIISIRSSMSAPTTQPGMQTPGAPAPGPVQDEPKIFPERDP